MVAGDAVGGDDADAALATAEGADGEEPLLMGEAGRRYVADALSERDPAAVIEEMHSSLALPAFIPSVGPVLEFLDLLGARRADSCVGVMECVRSRLLEEVERMPQARVLELLCRVVPFMGTPEMKPVCTRLLERSGKLPAHLLSHLALPENYVHAPLEVRQQIWRTREELFREAVFPLMSQFIADARNVAGANDVLQLTPAGRLPPRRRRDGDASVREMVRLMGEHRGLYLMLCGFMRTLFVNTGVGLFCTLRVAVLMSAHDREPSAGASHVSQWDRTHRFCWTMDAAIRDRKVSTRAAREMASFIPPHGASAPRTAEELGDLAMVARDPHALHTLCSTLLSRLQSLVRAAAAVVESDGGVDGGVRAGAGLAALVGASVRAHVPEDVRAFARASDEEDVETEEDDEHTDDPYADVVRLARRKLTRAFVSDEVLLFGARVLAIAHGTAALLKAEAVVPADDRLIEELVANVYPRLCEMLAEDDARGCGILPAWAVDAPALAGSAAAPGAEPAAPTEPAAPNGEGVEPGSGADGEGSEGERASKRPRRAAAGARGRHLAAEAEAAAELAEAGADEADGWVEPADEGADDAAAADDPDVADDASGADGQAEARGKAPGARSVADDVLMRSPSARRLTLHYALQRTRAHDEARCEGLFALAGSLAEVGVEEHLDFIYSLVELITASAAAAGSAKGGAHEADAEVPQGPVPPVMFEAALHKVLIPLAVVSAPCHEQLVRTLCVYAARVGAGPAGEVAKWAVANALFDEAGLVDSAYRELIRLVPSLRSQLQLPAAREAALKKTPSSAASDVVSDGTHMEMGLWDNEGAEGDAEQDGSGAEALAEHPDAAADPAARAQLPEDNASETSQ